MDSALLVVEGKIHVLEVDDIDRRQCSVSYHVDKFVMGLCCVAFGRMHKLCLHCFADDSSERLLALLPGHG